MPAITSQNVAEAIPRLVAAQALPALIGRIILPKLVNRDYESALAAAGDTINVAIPPTLVANNIAEGGTVTLQNNSLGNASLVLNSHREASFQIPDITRALSSVDLMRTYMEPAINALAIQMETDIFALYPYFTYNASLGGASTITETVVDTAETNLFKALVPQGTAMNFVCAPTTFSSLRQIGRFTEYQTTGANQNDAIVGSGLAGRTSDPAGMGADGRVKNLNVYRSQYVPFASSAYQNFAFTKDAIMFATRRLPEAPPGLGVIQNSFEFMGYTLRVTLSYQSNVLGNQVTIDTLYGAAALRQQFGQVLQAT